MTFSLVTPYVTDMGLEAIEKILDLLSDRNPGSEVVFNDWGVLELLQDRFPMFVPVMGRLLNKNKRGPRLMNIFSKLPLPTKKYYTGSNLDVSYAIKFLKKYNVARVEFDNLLQDINFADMDKTIKKSVYITFVFVSTTRLCLSANCDNPRYKDYIGVFSCNKECQKYTFYLENPVMGVTLIRQGNTIFFLNERIPGAVSAGLVDRVVVEPEIPI